VGCKAPSLYLTPLKRAIDVLRQPIDLGLKGWVGKAPNQGWNPCTPFKAVKSTPWQRIAKNLVWFCFIKLRGLCMNIHDLVMLILMLTPGILLSIGIMATFAAGG
jgi:hypothetical protein